MASNTLTTQDDDLEDEMLEVITSGNHSAIPTSGGFPQAVTLVGTQNIFTGPTPAGTVGEATLDLQISAAKEVFVEAEVFRTAKRKLEEIGHVTICGAPGEGKTTTALMLGSQYRRNGYKLAFVDRIDQFDLDSFLSSSPRVCLIIDDMFGSVGLSTDVSQLKPFLSKLLPHLQRCKTTLGKQHSLRNHPAKKGGEQGSRGVSDPAEQPLTDIRVVFTSKTYNFHDGLAQMQYEGFSLFKGQTVVDITTQTEHRYTQEEKKAIFEKHRNLHKKCSHEGNENDKDYEDMLQCDLWDVDSVFGFPLTCKLFFEFSSFSKHMMNYFKEPLLYLRLELKSLLGSKTDRSAILVLMLLCEEKLDLAMLESAGKDEALDNMITNVSDLFPKASRSGMYEAAKGFRGTFFTHGDTVGFAHSSIYDACACALYKISPKFVLTHCSDNFIYERVQPQPVSETEIDDHLHVIYISDSYYDILTTRLAKSIKDGHFSKSVTHPILQQDQIVLQLLEKLQPDESMEENWFHKREMGHSFLFWTVLGHSSKFPKYIEKKTGEEFTQREISESFEGCVFKNNVTLLKWLFSRLQHPVLGITMKSLLFLSARHGSSDTLLYLLEEGDDTVTTAENYKTIIHIACRTGQEKILNVLQEHKSDLFKTAVMNFVDDEGKTPLMEAAQAGSNDCYQILKSMSKKNIRDKSGNAIVHYASSGGNIVVVQDIVSSSNINSRGQYGLTPVMVAACKGHQSVVDLLLSKKADLTLLDDHGNSLLHHACTGGNTAIVQHVLSSSNINTRGHIGRTPVLVAAAVGEQSVFDLLVSEKADLTLQDDYGDSLLHLACYGDNTAIVQHVLSPSNINTRGQYGLTPVMTAACIGHKSVFELIVSEKADLTLLDDHGNGLLHHACIGGNTDIVEHVVSPSNINTRGCNGKTPVMTAAVAGQKRVFDLVSEKADLTLMDDLGDSLLHIACAGGNTAIVQHVLSPSNINSRGHDGHTPVMVAACKGHQSVFDLLVSKKADLTLVDDLGDSLLHHACIGSNTAIVQHVLSPSNINTRGQDGHTPVMVAASKAHQSVFDLLVSKEADLTLLDNLGDSLLHIACAGGHTAIVQHLLSPSNINTRGQDGHTPVMVAASKAHQSVFDLLVSKKADLTLVDDLRDSLLHHACIGGNTAIVQHVLLPSNINTRGQYGLTPVMVAACKGHQSVFDLLVSKEADLTLVDDLGDSLLHHACIGGYTAIAQPVLSPSNINTRGQYGLTPVMVAAWKGHLSVFDLLVSKEADLTLSDDRGYSLLHLACIGGNTAIVQHVVSSSNINTRGHVGQRPVMVAACKRHHGVFDLLVSKEADLTLLDDHGDSLLHHACIGGNTAIVQHAVSSSNINTRGQYGYTPVMVAAGKGHQSVFDLLMSVKADLTLLDDHGNSLLHHACNGGNTATVQHVVSPSNINTRGQYGRTPVMSAAGKGHQSVFDLLVSKKADLTPVDNLGDSLLHLACFGGNTAIVQHVISPFNINTRGQVGRTPVMSAAGKGHQSVFDLLVSKKADLTPVDNLGDSLLHIACAGGNTAIVQHVLSPSNINSRGQYGYTPVTVAACKGHQSVFDLLVSKKADLTLLDNHGNSLLHLACIGGNTAIVQHVVSPSNINTGGLYGFTPVMAAACEGHKSVFDLLLSKKADLTLVDDHGNSLLHHACYGGNTAIVQHVVSPSNINTRGQVGRTPVMVAAALGQQSVFELLVSKKADLTLLDVNGNSLLHLACTGGNKAIVQHVVSPSNINTRGQYGRTPVMTAAAAGQQSVFDLLVSTKADLTPVDNLGDSLLHLACFGSNTAIVQHVISPFNINTRGQDGRTPVMTAAAAGHQSVFDLLVSKKADLTLLDNHGNSLLHLACIGGNTAIVQHVVSPSNINTGGLCGFTPVMAAACEGHKSVFDLLLSKKADLTLVDDHGYSLLHYACYGGNTAIVQHVASPSNINTRGQVGRTPVMVAAALGQQSVFDLLVSKETDLTLLDDHGNSLLHLACIGGNTAIVQHVLSPSNINLGGQSGLTPIVVAANQGHQRVFDLLVSRNADLTQWIAIVIVRFVLPFLRSRRQ